MLFDNLLTSSFCYFTAIDDSNRKVTNFLCNNVAFTLINCVWVRLFECFEFFAEFCPAFFLFVHSRLYSRIFVYESHIGGVLRLAKQGVNLRDAVLHCLDLRLRLLDEFLYTANLLLLLLMLGVAYLARTCCRVVVLLSSCGLCRRSLLRTHGTKLVQTADVARA